MSECEMLPNIVNSVGLVFDILGVVILFFTVSVQGRSGGAGTFANRPITPLMHYSPRPRPALHPERSFSNISQEIPAVHLPNLTAHQGFVV